MKLPIAFALRAPWPKQRSQWVHVTVAGLLVQGAALLVLAIATHARITHGPEFDLAMLWIVCVNRLGAASMMSLMLKADEAT